jgi:hypothetical protein
MHLAFNTGGRGALRKLISSHSIAAPAVVRTVAKSSGSMPCKATPIRLSTELAAKAHMVRATSAKSFIDVLSDCKAQLITDCDDWKGVCDASMFGMLAVMQDKVISTGARFETIVLSRAATTN